VTSPAAASGTHTFTVIATNAANNFFEGSGTADYEVNP
jgi:hypothetical protein